MNQQLSDIDILMPQIYKTQDVHCSGERRKKNAKALCSVGSRKYDVVYSSSYLAKEGLKHTIYSVLRSLNINYYQSVYILIVHLLSSIISLRLSHKLQKKTLHL